MPVPILEMADPAGAAASADILAVVGRTGGRRRMCLAFRAGGAGFVIILTERMKMIRLLWMAAGALL